MTFDERSTERAEFYGQLFKDKRKAKRISVAKIAEQMGTDRKSVERIEKGLGVNSISYIKYLMLLGVIE